MGIRFAWTFFRVKQTAKAVYDAISKTYAYLTPDLWTEHPLPKHPFDEFKDKLEQAQLAKQYH